MIPKNSVQYCHAIIVCHGKSEVILSSLIKQITRLPFCIDSEKNGEKSIQITSILKHFGNANYSHNFTRLVGENTIAKDKTGFHNFKIFTIMDEDEAELTPQIISDYRNGKMFSNLEFSKYISPIYNNENFDSVMKKCGIKGLTKKNKIDRYISLFKRKNFLDIGNAYN